MRAQIAVLAIWAGFIALVQRWPSWEEGIRVQFANDMGVYEVIARAAPSLPDTDILRAYAQRFAPHWVVGVLSDATDVSLHSLYRIVAIACVGLILVAVHVALAGLGLDLPAYALALGAVAASAYPVQYLLAAPGMASDGIFVLGLAIVLLGFVQISPWVVVAGLGLATVGRQSALPLAVAAAAWAAFYPAWRPVRKQVVAGCLLIPAALYLFIYLVSDSFSQPRPAGIDDLTVIGFFTSFHEFGRHVGLVALGIAVPAALVVGSWLRVRGPVPWGPLLLAITVAGQPLVLGPLANRSNEPRLAGLAAPALAVTAAILLRGASLTRVETLVCAAAIAVGGLHHRYTNSVFDSNVAWAIAVLISALVIASVLALGRPRSKTAPA